MWVVCLRAGVNHRDDETTELCEGGHCALKAVIRAQGGESVRLDRLIHHLLTFVAQPFVDKDIRGHSRIGEFSASCFFSFWLAVSRFLRPCLISKTREGLMVRAHHDPVHPLPTTLNSYPARVCETLKSYSSHGKETNVQHWHYSALPLCVTF
jgi:hypothetical protein